MCSSYLSAQFSEAVNKTVAEITNPTEARKALYRVLTGSDLPHVTERDRAIIDEVIRVVSNRLATVDLYSPQPPEGMVETIVEDALALAGTISGVLNYFDEKAKASDDEESEDFEDEFADELA